MLRWYEMVLLFPPRPLAGVSIVAAVNEAPTYRQRITLTRLLELLLLLVRGLVMLLSQLPPREMLSDTKGRRARSSRKREHC